VESDWLGSGATGGFTEELKGKLISSASGAPVAIEPTAEPRFYMFYRGASWWWSLSTIFAVNGQIL